MHDRDQNDAVDQQSDFIVYVDESGDHSLEKIDENYPVFVLAFCVFYKNNYIENVVSAVERLKFDNFGHDIVILHERDIRKELGVFKFRDRKFKDYFLNLLTSIISDSKFILISCLIDKRSFQQPLDGEANPYHFALSHCLEALSELLDEKKQSGRKTHIVFERRGKKEDNELELEFRRLCDEGVRANKRLPFEIVFADKKVNSAGLQLADLVARPIGISHLRPEQPNRAFDMLRRKFFCKGGRQTLGQDYEGWGLKIFPPPKSEKPR